MHLFFTRSGSFAVHFCVYAAFDGIRYDRILEYPQIPVVPIAQIERIDKLHA